MAPFQYQFCLIVRIRSLFGATRFNFFFQAQRLLVMTALHESAGAFRIYSQLGAGEQAELSPARYLGKLKNGALRGQTILVHAAGSGAKSDEAAIAIDDPGWELTFATPRARTFQVAVPPVTDAGAQLTPSAAAPLADLVVLKQVDADKVDYHGRVTQNSTKNFQLCREPRCRAPDEPPDHVVVQFGRVGNDSFHCDYRTPLNAFQAFGVALAALAFAGGT